MAAAAARPPPPPTMVIQDDYIDMDLTPASTQASSPRFEFRSAAVNATRRRGEKEEEEVEDAFASPADELFYKGNLLPLHLPPRLQLVQRLLQEQQTTQQQGVKRREAVESDDALPPTSGATTVVGAKVAASNSKKPSWSKRLKVVKRWASRVESIRSLFLATAARPSDIVVDGNGSCGSVSARAAPAAPTMADHEEVCHHHHHRKSFSGIIRRVRLVVATKASTASSSPAPGVSPMCSSSSSSSSSSTPSCGNANGFFFRPAAAGPPALKRSNSAGSEEGAIQGAIAHCKRSQQGTTGARVSAERRSSASDVVFYSVTNTPRASSVAAGEVAQERQEMCRG